MRAWCYGQRFLIAPPWAFLIGLLSLVSRKLKCGAAFAVATTALLGFVVIPSQIP